jgi:predicted alpha-1,2-mannosidase
MRCRPVVLCVLALGLAAAAPATAEDLTPLVHPLSGSLGAGFPTVGAFQPFGMVAFGPDTGLPGGEDPVDYTGYGFQDPEIRGFSLTHFSGAGIHIGGDLPFMPTTGAVSSEAPDRIASPYSHATETAQPGYYAVTLAASRTKVELTATPRGGMLRATYPATTQANLILNAATSIGATHPAAVSVVGDRGLEGWAQSDVGYRVYFSAAFDRPFAAAHAFAGGEYVTFDTTQNPVVTMRVAISYLDQAGARANLAAELPEGTSFDAVRRAAHDAWDARLHDAVVSGGDPGQRATFYTNLYRALSMPTVFDDADGRYLGFDGAVHEVAPGAHHYTNLSLWDTYRTQTPLLELLEPRVAHDVASLLVDDADQNHGVVPRWTQANRDRGIMGGDSGSATLADLVTAGALRGAAAAHAYDLLLAQATTIPAVWPRGHLESYVSRGYIGYDESDIGVPLTQEYATDDAAVAQVARLLGHDDAAAMLERRAGGWRNLLDPQTKFLRPRTKDGSWVNPTQGGPVALPWRPELSDGYQEATGWQALWAEPQDVAGLFDAIGGRDVARRRLAAFFATALNQPAAPIVPAAQQQGSFFGIYYVGNQYTPANETDLWAPWYFDWAGQPWKTQKVVRAEMSVYDATPRGLPGNDDAGSMSAWYVLAALGLYHAAPGVSAWELTSPAFDTAVVRRRLTIASPGASAARPYVHGFSLDGRPLSRTWLTGCELARARRLSAVPAALPDRRWGTGPGAAPPSLSDPGGIPAPAPCR